MLASSGILKESYIFKLIYWITDMINGEYFFFIEGRARIVHVLELAQSQMQILSMVTYPSLFM